MTSFFNKIYKYKQSELRHQKENFLTEIFAYCLMNDLNFRQKFLNLLDCNENVDIFNCFTQQSSNEFGKPDILIEINNNTIIIIECKVDSSQEETQLKRYSNILLKHKSENKFLIYLTKLFEETETFDPPIRFHPLKWYDVSDLLNDSQNDISKELYEYLKEEKMSKKITFNKSELSAIKDIQETYSKMNEFILLIKDKLKPYVNSKIVISKKIENGDFGITTDFHSGTLWLGFFQYDDLEMQICISIEVPLTNSNFDEMDATLNSFNWSSYDDDDGLRRTWFKKSSISTFFIDDMFSSNKALTFLENEIEKIKIYF